MTVRFGYIAEDWRTIADALAPVEPGALGVLAEHLDRAGVALAVALEDLDRRRLARAVRAEQPEDLAHLRSRSRCRAEPRTSRTPSATR